MKNIIILFFIFLIINPVTAQPFKHWPYTVENTYKAAAAISNQLYHTKLEIQFDLEKEWLFGKAWLSIKPYHYTSHTVTLDAKWMDIKEIALVSGEKKQALQYTYDSLRLFITLDKAYAAGESYTLYIDYTAKPGEFAAASKNIDAASKGLYFIHATGSSKDKPVQVWSHGGTDYNSVWMPTIDNPNQKTTSEINITVLPSFVTLSNGLLVKQKNNPDGSRTDTWKMDTPHSPYLFFAGAGNFSVIKDSYKGKEVSYYVEKKQEPFARKIFGSTPEMIDFFSARLQVDFPWQKYSQIVVREYMNGAMENTTAVLHQEDAYQDSRELTDGNRWETTIAHEVFHHWFGNLVTPESWSNIAVSEGPANYGEYLWLEYKYGKDVADEHGADDIQLYLADPANALKKTIRFEYDDKEALFDAVSFNKSGRILHMLRNYVGEDAFWLSLGKYLSVNRFKSTEATHLRMAFEEVTGEDLSWFWNQWYYGNGHPKLKIHYGYIDSSGRVTVAISQLQKNAAAFKLPIAIDVYTDSAPQRHYVWLTNMTDTFTFSCGKKPLLVNADADKVLLCEKTENKTAAQYIYQLENAPLYADRREAIEYLFQKNMTELMLGLQDKYAGIRRLTIEKLEQSKLAKNADIIAAVEKITGIEKDKKTLAAAIRLLGNTADKKYDPLYSRFINDSSYTVAAASLEAQGKLYPEKLYTLAKKYSSGARGPLQRTVMKILTSQGADADFEYVAGHFGEMSFNEEKLLLLGPFVSYLGKIKNVDNIKKGIALVLKTKALAPARYKAYTDPLFNSVLKELATIKGGEIELYIKTVSP